MRFALPSHPSQRALSLIELVVTMAVLGLLAALALSASAPQIQRARRISCLANLRSWGIATHVHATDHSDFLPMDGAPNGISTRDAWYADLPISMGMLPYHKEGAWRTNPSVQLPHSPWICPSNRRHSNGRILFHYTLNRKATGSGPDERQRLLTLIPEPSTLVWLFDNGGVAAVAAEGNAHPRIHGAGGQFLFMDGHVQRLSNAAYWDTSKDRPLNAPIGLRWAREPHP